MKSAQEPKSLVQVIERIRKICSEETRVSIGDILKAFGHRSFGPLLLMAGLVTLAPIIGDVPGIPTLMAVLVVMSAGQLLLQREHFWFPHWMLSRSVKQQALDKVLSRFQPVAKLLDRWLHERMPLFIQNTGVHAIAITCIFIAAAMPFMEFVPFSANGAGIGLTAFGLSLIFRDGLLALLAMIVTLGTLAVVVASFV